MVNHDRLRIFAAGFYAWILSVISGMILCDIAYARILTEHMSRNIIQALFSEAADLLLWMNGVAILTAVGAIILSYSTRSARNLLITSLFIIIFELIFPVFISIFIKNTENLSIGPWVRIILSVSATLCAFMGLVVVIRNKKSGTLIASRP